MIRSEQPIRTKHVSLLIHKSDSLSILCCITHCCPCVQCTCHFWPTKAVRMSFRRQIKQVEWIQPLFHPHHHSPNHWRTSTCFIFHSTPSFNIIVNSLRWVWERRLSQKLLKNGCSNIISHRWLTLTIVSWHYG